MAWRGMFNWLAPFKIRETDQREAGFTSMIELEKLRDEFLILASLHNELIDLIRHRKIKKFKRVLVGRILELNYNTLDDYTVFPGGFYLLEKDILSVVNNGNTRIR